MTFKQLKQISDSYNFFYAGNEEIRGPTVYRIIFLDQAWTAGHETMEILRDPKCQSSNGSMCIRASDWYLFEDLGLLYQSFSKVMYYVYVLSWKLASCISRACMCPSLFLLMRG